MTAAQALKAAWAAGIRVGIDGEDLVLNAPAPPPTAILDALARNKAGVIELMRPGQDGWTAADWHAFFDKRAAIAEFDNLQPRANAEAQAFASCVIEWLNRNSAQSVPGRCPGCGGGDRQGDPLLPFGTETTGHVWLHGACWPAWYRERRGEAVTALRALGLRGPQHAEPMAKLLPTPKTEILAVLAAPDSDAAMAPLEYGADFETPCDARRGKLDERPDGLFLHFCIECGAWGAFGYGVNLRAGRQGRWYCAAHRPGVST